jgi:hypothetical protein
MNIITRSIAAALIGLWSLNALANEGSNTSTTDIADKEKASVIYPSSSSLHDQYIRKTQPNSGYLPAQYGNNAAQNYYPGDRGYRQ